VPDSRTNRGAHPRDAECFRPEALPALRQACSDLCWLLTRGYPKSAALKLVGDRWGLRARQRTALQRCAAGDREVAGRSSRRRAAGEVAGAELAVDGYNVLLTVEVALGGGVVLAGRDGTYRDMASVSGSYRKVHQTRPALEALAAVLGELGCRRVHWLLDRPVSNSGRLKALIETAAAEGGWPWSVELSVSPDRDLIAGDAVAATADSAVLDRCGAWLNLAREVVDRSVPAAWVVEL
jgi:hypothetical protein